MPLIEIGMYELLEIFIFYSIAVVYYSFCLIIALSFLLFYKVLISSKLSNIIPLDSESRVRILSWAYFNDFFPSDIETTT